jgi:prepilin-type N-terminal cleavage/methylation domain-containing protein
MPIAVGIHPIIWPMKQAFSLPELVLVLAVAGILLGIAVTSLIRIMDSIEVDGAATHLVAAHQRARMMAVARGQVLTLSVDSARLSITPSDGSPALWSESGPGESRVRFTGPARRFTFSPEGITLGLSNATLRLDRGASSRTIVISRLGRVRIAR